MRKPDPSARRVRRLPPPAAEGISGWLLAKQAEFYRALSGTIRAAKTDGSAVFALFGISFLYGVFHAAGPGHGKAVISSYMVANEEAWRRGVVLSFASALLQALVAIAIVGIGAILLGATARTMTAAREVDRDRELRSDRGAWSLVALGERARAYRGAAQHEAAAGRGRRRGGHAQCRSPP